MNETAVVAGTATEVVPTGKIQHDSRAYPAEFRWFLRGGIQVLQERWECQETNYDDETGRSWKEWRDIPIVEERAE